MTDQAKNIHASWNGDSDAVLRRIEHMEAIHDRCRTAVDALLGALEQFQACASELTELEQYYLSHQWLSDRAADQQGRIPQDLKRGILAEDTIYDLLTDHDRMMTLLRELNRS